MNGRDPGGTGIGNDHAGGAQYGDTAENSQARIHGPLRHLFTVRHGNFHIQISRHPCIARQTRQLGGHHGAGHRIDRRLPDRDRQAGLGHGADAVAGQKTYAAAVTGALTHAGMDHRAVGDVRVVARVLFHRRHGHAVAKLLPRETERDDPAARQVYFHRIRENSGQQGAIGRLGRRRGACPRGPSAPQGRFACRSRHKNLLIAYLPCNRHGSTL